MMLAMQVVMKTLSKECKVKKKTKQTEQKNPKTPQTSALPY